MNKLIAGLLIAFCVTNLCGAQTEVVTGETIEPIEVDCKSLAFYPRKWEQAGADFSMLAWEGSQVVLVTKRGNYDKKVVSQFVRRLDQGWEVYRELIGKSPRRFKQVNGKPTIVAIPKPNLSCGYGCGYVGSSGIEASMFYQIDLPSFKKNPNGFQHYYFYEMGRNYFVFGDRHSLFTTGFAVFMRNVCMDRLNCDDSDARTRATIERCEEVYAKSEIGFYDAFTNLGNGEKSNRLKDESGRVIAPSDQPVMYATAMLKLRRDYGGDEWVRKFFKYLHQCKPRSARNIETAETQCLNWLVCASAAAGKDLSPIFADRWRMPLTGKQREIMKSTDWSSTKMNVESTVERLLNARN